MKEAARAALAEDDAGGAVGNFLRWYVDFGTLRLTSLLGSFIPSAPLFDLARDVNRAMQALVDRAVAQRTRALRHRYVTLALQGLALTDAPELPGPPPDADELEAPWRTLRPPSPRSTA